MAVDARAIFHLQGFFYNKFPEPKKGDLGTETDINLNQQLCYHVVGQPQSRDAVVWACPDHPAWMMGAEVTDDGRSACPLRCCSSCFQTSILYYTALVCPPVGACVPSCSLVCPVLHSLAG